VVLCVVEGVVSLVNTDSVKLMGASVVTFGLLDGIGVVTGVTLVVAVDIDSV
jgi:hypothetical protein